MKVGISKSLCVVKIILLKIKVIAIGIIGVRIKPRTLHTMFMLRRFKLPLLVSTVPASDKIITIVRIMESKKVFCGLYSMQRLNTAILLSK